MRIRSAQNTVWYWATTRLQPEGGLKNMKTGEKKEIDLSKNFVEQYVCLSTEQEDFTF